MDSSSTGNVQTQPLWTVEGEETFTDLYRRGQVGDCVNSVAHDLNNYLGAMLSYAELVGMDENIPDDSKRMLGELGSAVQKSTQLLATLTAIARAERPNAVMTDMASLVDRVIALRKYEFGMSRIKVETAVIGEPHTIVVDEPKMIRSILALFVNAVEQFDGTTPSKIDITVETTEDGIEVRIKDSGPGVGEEDRNHLFEPFFTTKGDGHLGLGLTQARKCAQHHNGGLRYDTELGFVLTLPKTTGLG